MEIKELNVDRHDCGKYACFSTSGSESFARFYFNDDGSINEKLTYSKHYYEQLHPKESKVKEKVRKKRMILTQAQALCHIVQALLIVLIAMIVL